MWTLSKHFKGNTRDSVVRGHQIFRKKERKRQRERVCGLVERGGERERKREREKWRGVS